MIFFIHISFDGVTPKIDFFQKDFFFWMTWTENWILWSVLTWFLNFFIEILWWIYGLKRLLYLRWVFDLGCFVWKRPIFDDGLNVEDLVLDLNLCELWKNYCISLRGRSFDFGGGRLRKAWQNLKFTEKNHTNAWQGQEGVKNRLNDVYKGFLDPYAEIFMIF